MPGRWYPTQTVSANGRVEWPKGPIDFPLPAGFTPTWLEAWVVQGGPPTQGQTFVAGPSQSCKQSLRLGTLLCFRQEETRANGKQPSLGGDKDSSRPVRHRRRRSSA